jgi:hypothetical protein
MPLIFGTIPGLSVFRPELLRNDAQATVTCCPLDLLRVQHERIEAWILELAGVQFDAETAPGGLRVVA